MHLLDRSVLGVTFEQRLVGGLDHFLFFNILGIILPIDSYFSEGLTPPTRLFEDVCLVTPTRPQMKATMLLRCGLPGKNAGHDGADREYHWTTTFVWRWQLRWQSRKKPHTCPAFFGSC